MHTATEITSHLKPDDLLQNPSRVLDALSRFSSALKVHLTMEDKALYPALLSHPNTAISTLAKAFSEEMGGIKEEFVKYSTKWSSPEAIQNSVQEFIQETEAIFGAVATRVEKENHHLYTMVDDLSTRTDSQVTVNNTIVPSSEMKTVVASAIEPEKKAKRSSSSKTKRLPWQDIIAAIEQLSQLRDKQIISPEEFEGKKKELLSRM